MFEEEVGFMGDGSQLTKVKKSSVVDVEAIPGQCMKVKTSIPKS